MIASGGAGTLEHMAEVLTRGGADAVLAASIFHFGEYDVAAVKEYSWPVSGIPCAEGNAACCNRGIEALA